ncbi:hypothetical protein EX30DRAFT_397175 [Ascodesmis nigricans]|uniref:Transmembrane protein n=1 Tax=Ascodesmis nigricans TaxID=341454 RepID=A0A4S2MS93_9PEZI|nr:hypothetical protein EX30DRAFT_397175 [Ascodesmis nigricans]
MVGGKEGGRMIYGIGLEWGIEDGDSRVGVAAVMLDPTVLNYYSTPFLLPYADRAELLLVFRFFGSEFRFHCFVFCFVFFRSVMFQPVFILLFSLFWNNRALIYSACLLYYSLLCSKRDKNL